MANIKYIPSTNKQERNWVMDDIGIGTIFRCKGSDETDLYIRIDCGLTDNDYNAIHLPTGEPEWIGSKDEIEIVRKISYSEDDVDKTTPIL